MVPGIAVALLLSKNVETAASRSQLWDSKKKLASSLVEEVISQKELIRASSPVAWGFNSWASASIAFAFCVA